MSDLKTTSDNSEDIDLEYSRQKRKQLVDSLTDKGMPTDIKDQSIMLQALDGLDRQALSKKKLKSDEGISSAAVMAAAMLAQLYNKPDLKALSVSNNNGSVQVFMGNEPIDIIDGELEVVPSMTNYDNFMSQFDQ
jgi:hypothetical protein